MAQRQRAIRSQAILPLPAIPATLLLLVCLVLPAALMLTVSFAKVGIGGIEWTFSLQNYKRILMNQSVLWTLWRSIALGVCITAILLTLAFPVAYWIARQHQQIRPFLVLLIIVPYWISYVIRSYAWYPLLGVNGLINYVLVGTGILDEPSNVFLFSPLSVWLGLIYVYFPFATVPIYLALLRIDKSVVEASVDLGATRFQTFWRVIFPLALPGVIGAGMLVFILTTSAYVTPKLLGGPSSIMFGELIADQFGATFDWPYGAALAMAHVVIVAAIVGVAGRRFGLERLFLGRGS